MRFDDDYFAGCHDFESEMLSEVAAAVYAEDMARARRALDELHRGARDETAEVLRRAKARAIGRQQVVPDLAEPLVLPQPGVSSDVVFGRGGNPPPQGRLRS